MPSAPPAVRPTGSLVCACRPQAGVMEEMMEDALDAVDDGDVEEEADEEVDAVLYEITAGQFGTLAAPSHGVAAAAPARVAVGAGAGAGAGDDSGLSDLEARFRGL